MTSRFDTIQPGRVDFRFSNFKRYHLITKLFSIIPFLWMSVVSKFDGVRRIDYVLISVLRDVCRTSVSFGRGSIVVRLITKLGSSKIHFEGYFSTYLHNSRTIYQYIVYWTRVCILFIYTCHVSSETLSAFISVQCSTSQHICCAGLCISVFWRRLQRFLTGRTLSGVWSLERCFHELPLECVAILLWGWA